jgi:hypothetical protein
MPHYTNYGGTTHPSVQHEKEGFGSFEPREAKFQEAFTNDELTGLKGLNWSELCDVGTSLRQSDDFIKLGDIKGDRLFTAGGGGDSITGEGRSTNIWTTVGPSNFEGRMHLDFDLKDVVTCNGITLDTEAPSMSMHQGAMNSVWGKDSAGNFLDAAGSMTETFESAPGMNSFGESLNFVLEITGTAGPGGSTYMTGQFGMPTHNISGTAGPGGTSF